MSRTRSLGLAALLALAIAPQAGAGNAAVGVSGTPFLAELGPHVETLLDPTRALTVEQVMRPEWSARFAPNAVATPSFGFTRAAVWVRFRLESSAHAPETIMLELGMARMRHFTWYVVGDESVEDTLACGAMDAPAQRHPLPRYPTMSLSIPAGATRTVYARAESDAAIWLPLVAGTPLAFEDFASHRNFWDFAYVGFCAALAMLSFGLWVAGGRSRLYLSVSFAMVFGLLHVMIFNGLYAWLGGPWPQWVSYQGLPLCVMLFALAFARFAADYLAWDKLTALERNALMATYALCAAAAAMCVVLPFSTLMKIVLPLQVLSLSVPAAVSASVSLRRRGRGMSLFLAAWLVLIAAVLLLVLQFAGLVPIIVPPAEALRIALPSVFFVFMLAGSNAQQAVLQMQAQVAQLNEAETRSRLEALRYQLNPHFLFNTLTSIEELSHDAPARIPRLVGRLAEFLRLRLKPEPSSEITLARELDSVRAYLEIEQVRFEERLRVEYSIAPGAGACLVPELVLMPLVENALKYGFEDSEHLRLRIYASARDGHLILRVENNGNLRVDRRKHGAGVGTINLRERLALKYGGEGSFWLAQEGDAVVAEVRIPATERNQ